MANACSYYLLKQLFMEIALLTFKLPTWYLY